MQPKILNFLKKNPEYVSGEEISNSLNISRQALWKHIESMREDGYDILAVPHLGYKLISSPDRLFASEIKSGLNTKIIGSHIYYFDSLDSTMNTAMQLGIKAASEGTVVLAEAQKKGRGRLGRDWVSPKYKGIYLSLILRPQIPPGQLPILTLLTAVSICEALESACSLDAKIKWPNDIFVHNKKLGGILTELNAEMDEVRFVVIGVGLNVNNDKNSLLPGATSIAAEKGQAYNRVYILQQILRNLEKNYFFLKTNGGDFIIKEWRLRNITLGRRVKISLHKDHIEGEAVDIDSDGALLLRKDSGLTHRVTAGDVTHCR